MPQPWFEILASVALGVAVLCCVYLLVAVIRRPCRMAVMNWVWPITALYCGPVAILAFHTLSHPRDTGKASSKQQHHGSRSSYWQTVFVGVTHCGAGCTLGDLIAEWTIFLFAVTLAGTDYWPNVLLAFALAYLLGIAFQYFAIAPMRGISGFKGIWAATKADTLSLTAFEVGLFAWMALTSFVIFPHAHANSPAFWFMMQIGMIVGFATSYPMNWWLIRKGIKEAM